MSRQRGPGAGDIKLVFLVEGAVGPDALGVDDQLELMEAAEGFIVRPRRIDLSLLGGLRDKIDPGTEPFEVRKLRDAGYDSTAYRD